VGGTDDEFGGGDFHAEAEAEPGRAGLECRVGGRFTRSALMMVRLWENRFCGGCVCGHAV
ncbi:MAG: hypothetical protein O3C21_06875, partial [Verrucomicrobia bacterium]|nr:hypothetical protein [Verrucomicrobiota bacterium]